MFPFEPRVRSSSWEEVGVRNTGRCGSCEVRDASRALVSWSTLVCGVFRTRRLSGSIQRAVNEPALEQNRDRFDVADLVGRHLEEVGIEHDQVG